MRHGIIRFIYACMGSVCSAKGSGLFHCIVSPANKRASVALEDEDRREHSTATSSLRHNGVDAVSYRPQRLSHTDSANAFCLFLQFTALFMDAFFHFSFNPIYRWQKQHF